MTLRHDALQGESGTVDLGLTRAMGTKAIAGVFIVVLILLLLSPVYGLNPFGGGGSGVRIAGEVELTQDEPVVAVEFEASFTTLQDESGIYANFNVVAPRDPRDRPGTLPSEGFRKELWDGADWVSYEGPPEIGQLGLNTFRVRWVFELAPEETETAFSYEVEIKPTYNDGSDSQPTVDSDYQDLTIAVIATYPIEGS